MLLDEYVLSREVRNGDDSVQNKKNESLNGGINVIKQHWKCYIFEI